LVIDLRSLTVISREGEEAIFDLMKKGAKFTCAGVLTRHVLKHLARKKQRNHHGGEDAGSKPHHEPYAVREQR